MNISSQIAKLREKAEQKTLQLMEISENIAKSKEQIKVLKKDIAYLNEQISALEMKQLSETLTSNGITKADIEAAIAGVQEKGGIMIDKAPRGGAGGMDIAFVHPKSVGILLELCAPAKK